MIKNIFGEEGVAIMRMYDLIEKKKYGKVLTKNEIEWIVDGFTKGEIPDYQMAAWLMAVYYKGMNNEEMTQLTMAMAHSGDMLDLSAIKGIKVDKHSTGGVGDKTTLIVAPIVAACGVKVAKMSGRGLGHTGGTIDKLESIPGFRTTLSKEEFFDGVNQNGLCVIGQSGNITPADKKIYALRDVTATVDSIPLIASSIMSKKLAAGSDCILLDVKTGSGAFMTTIEGSRELAKKMVAIGKGANRQCAALITDMDIPLGFAIGNSLEVIEAVQVLNGEGPMDLREVSLNLSARMIHMAKITDSFEAAYDMAIKVIEDKSALEKLKEMVSYQGGDVSVIEDTSKFPRAKFSMEVLADKDGYISHIDTHGCGIVSMVLGAGRETKDDIIDMAAGIILHKKYGEFVHKGESIATLYTNTEKNLINASKILLKAYVLNDIKPVDKPLIIDFVS